MLDLVLVEISLLAQIGKLIINRRFAMNVKNKFLGENIFHQKYAINGHNLSFSCCRKPAAVCPQNMFIFTPYIIYLLKTIFMGHKIETLSSGVSLRFFVARPSKTIHKWPGHFTILENYAIIDYLCSHQSKEFLFSLDSRHKSIKEETK